MQLTLHANAATTPKTRAYIQASTASVAELAAEIGVNETTIRRWRGRQTTKDHSSRPKRIDSSLSALDEMLVCELRNRLDLPLDDIVEVMRRCVNPKLSRSAIHRCLKRHGISSRPKPARPSSGRFEEAPIGFIHIDLKHLPALERRKSYAFVAIDRATRYVYMEIHPRRDAATAAAFLERFLAHFPAKLHTILTDNGSEFTDRFRHEGQARGKAVRQPPVRPRLRRGRHQPPPRQALPSTNQRHGRALQPPHQRGHWPRKKTRYRSQAVCQPR